MVNNIEYPTLISSHIKRSEKCNYDEKYDHKNLILISSEIDGLFDKGDISFEDNGNMLFAKNITDDLKKNFYKKKLNDNFLDEKRKKYEEIEKELIEINSNIDLLSQFDLMFSVNLSSEITSSSIKNISLLTTIFYEDNLIKTMINQLQEDVFKRDQLLKDITENNNNKLTKLFEIQLNKQFAFRKSLVCENLYY